jgi:hypothetical protein
MLNIFLYLVVAFIVIVIIYEIISSRSRNHKTEIKLREALLDRETFIGKDLDYCLDQLGIYTEGGSWDRGAESYSWRAKNVWAEALFQDGVCISFAEREN